jgi:hypothetical protein
MDVEGILNQIRERVVSESSAANDTRLATNGSSSNGSATAANYDDALQRLRTQLTIAGRAADRLPPVVSNRQGARARLELWLKSKSKPLSRWFTWEQVNFNRAIADALNDVVEVLSSEAQEIAAARAQLTALRTKLTQEMGAAVGELQVNQMQFQSATETTFARLHEAIANLTTETGNRDTELAEKHAQLAAQYECLAAEHNGLAAEHNKLANQVIDLAAQLRAEDFEIKFEQAEELNRRLSQMAAELKDEQRVCFRQISLETGESAVLADRARRALLTRLEQLEEALKSGSR